MVGTIRIGNKDFVGLNCTTVDIASDSILKNPFKMNSEEEREIVVRKFYHYFREEFKKKELVYEELMRLVNILKSGNDIYIKCDCYPKLCHAHIIKNAIMGIIQHEQRKQ